MSRPIRLSKYGAQPTEIDGIRFHSKKEARRYQELKLLERAGEIDALQLQPKYELWVYGDLICKYIADFSYLQEGCEIVEDVKGVRTREYKLKKKLMKACLGTEIKEV